MTNKQTIAVFLMLLPLILGGAYATGYAHCLHSNPTEVIETTHYYPEYQIVEVEKPYPVYQEPEIIEVTHTVNNTVERQTKVIGAKYVSPWYFESLEEIETFLDYWRANKMIIFLAGDLDSISNNCKEMAEQLSDMAAEQGYRFPTETLTPAEMYQVYGERFDRPHRVNKAWIPGVGEWYYDYNTDKLWRVW